MRYRFVSFAALASLVSVGIGVTACSSEDPVPPPHAVTTPATPEEAELKALDIGLDEPIGEESDPLTIKYDEETGDRLDEQDVTGAAENPVPEDADTQIVDDAEALSNPGEAPPVDPDGGLGTRSLRPLVTPGALPDNETRVNVGSKIWKCSQKTVRPCRCEGSPMNCELPSEQPGRNRYIPTSRVPTINAASGTKKVELIEHLGRWGINDGTTLYDGAGRIRGKGVKDQCYEENGTDRRDGVCVKINFGQRKMMKAEGDDKPRQYLYAFSLRIGDIAASSWIPRSAVISSNISAMPTVKAPTINEIVSTSYVLKSASDWGQNQATYDAKDLPAWSRAAVGVGYNKKRPALAADYLLRTGNVLNLCYQTPGVGGAATDTFVVGNNDLGFERVRSTVARPTLVRIKLQNSPEHPTMMFAYGKIAGRFGWVAIESIKKGKVNASGEQDSCVGKIDGIYCSEVVDTSAYVCTDGTIDYGLQCEPTQTCKGASADGKKIVCEDR